MSRIMLGLLRRSPILLRVHRRPAHRRSSWEFYWPDEHSYGAWNLGRFRFDFGMRR